MKHWDDLTLLSNISNISTIYWPGPGVWLILPPVHKHALLQVRPSTAAACQSPLWPPGRAELSNMKPKLQFAPRSGHKNRNFPRRHNEEMRIGNKPHSGSRSSAGHHSIQLAGWVMKCILNISYSSYINWQYNQIHTFEYNLFIFLSLITLSPRYGCLLPLQPTCYVVNNIVCLYKLQTKVKAWWNRSLHRYYDVRKRV